MAEDWDLWAVVRSCYTPAAAATNYVTPQEYPIPVSPPLVFEQNDNSFGRRNSGFEELDEVYRTFFANSQPIINPLLGGFNHQKPPQPINPNSNPTSSVSFLGGFCHQQEPQPMNPNIVIPTTPSSNSVLGGFKFNNQPEQEPKPKLLNPNMSNSSKQKTHFMNPNIMVAEEEEQKPQPPQPINPNIMDMSSVSVLDGFNGKEDEAEEQKPQLINPNMTPKKQQCRKHPQPPPPPPKPNVPEQCGYQYQRKKSQRTAVVEVEAENLPEVDPWNWRKYGRKPIKTSPYPRNYYKCSSEGNKCQAKKYVEKNPEDPEKFMVSYCGEHDHSPPRRRNALSCTSRKKSSTTTTKKENEDAVKMKEEDEDILNSENVFMGLQDLDGGGESGTSANDFDRSWSVNDDFSFSGPVVSMGF